MTHAKSRERRQAIADYIRQGNSVGEAAHHFGISYQTASVAARSAGIVIGRSLLDMRRQKVGAFTILAELLTTDDGYRVIAARHGISFQRVGEVLEKAIAAGIPGLKARKDRKREKKDIAS